jgi:hypothetical protein
VILKLNVLNHVISLSATAENHLNSVDVNQNQYVVLVSENKIIANVQSLFNNPLARSASMYSHHVFAKK